MSFGIDAFQRMHINKHPFSFSNIKILLCNASTAPQKHGHASPSCHFTNITLYMPNYFHFNPFSFTSFRAQPCCEFTIHQHLHLSIFIFSFPIFLLPPPSLMPHSCFFIHFLTNIQILVYVESNPFN